MKELRHKKRKRIFAVALGVLLAFTGLMLLTEGLGAGHVGRETAFYKMHVNADSQDDCLPVRGGASRTSAKSWDDPATPVRLKSAHTTQVNGAAGHCLSGIMAKTHIVSVFAGGHAPPDFL